MSRTTYTETFDHGPGGWYGWVNNAVGVKPLEVKSGAAITRSPWWIDYNHAPPGAGYLHMLFCLYTLGPAGEHHRETAGDNRFVAGRHSTNLARAKVSVRVRGELESRGASMVLLVQSNFDRLTSGWALTGRPISVGENWSEQTIELSPDPALWTCLGGRHDRRDSYGVHDLSRVLGDVNVNMMFILFPLTIAPMGPIDGDPHILRPGRDYPVWTSKLPEGYIMLDTVSITYP